MKWQSVSILYFSHGLSLNTKQVADGRSPETPHSLFHLSASSLLSPPRMIAHCSAWPICMWIHEFSFVLWFLNSNAIVQDWNITYLPELLSGFKFLSTWWFVLSPLNFVFMFILGAVSQLMVLRCMWHRAGYSMRQWHWMSFRGSHFNADSFE